MDIALDNIVSNSNIAIFGDMRLLKYLSGSFPMYRLVSDTG